MSFIHMETIGQGKPIVLVHGWAMHSGIWHGFAKELAKRYQVTLLDLPGHGLSGEVAPFALENITKELAKAMPESPSCWLGWSLGSVFVIELARRFPRRVNKLILLAGTPCFLKRPDWPGMDEKVLNNFAESLQQDVPATLLRFLSLQTKGDGEQKATLKKLQAFILERPSPNKQTLLEGLAVLKETDLRPVLANLHVPIAAILGELDTLVPFEVSAKMQELLPQMQLTVIARAGHMPFLTHQQEVVQTVSDFMDK